MTEQKAKEIVKKYVKDRLSTVQADVKIVKSKELKEVIKSVKTFLIVDWEQPLFRKAPERDLKVSNAINFLKKRDYKVILINLER